ncbi:MAG TPA: trypsin-like peptidase domain-containing protein [Patescibacteria group bacterium]|nr:trypsin-like peptidase domain-containing protein [Patescibacteria group bacterium]
MKERGIVILLVILAVVLVIWNVVSQHLPNLISSQGILPQSSQSVKVVNEQSDVVDVVKKVGPSVVTVGVENSPVSDQSQGGFGGGNSPFSFFFNGQDMTPNDQFPSQDQQDQQKEDYIGSGFVVERDGLIVTNKHVVSDTSLKYIIIDSKGNKYNVGNIYRDPLNDIAILKVSNPPGGGFQEITFGDSSKLEVGQFAIAIGTALGEFRNTVTTGVISGLGRGISAGSPFEGVEQLDNVIQTDAAINPGNSGGPLLNVSGQVIGVNSAVAQSGQNIGFAIPINVIRDSIKNFNETGQFNRPFLGVSYTMISQRAALLNDLPEGALVREVVDGSTAQKAGVQTDDIITKIDGQKVTDDNSLAQMIAKKKVGDTVTITVYRDGNSQDIKASLSAAPQQ